MRGKVGRFSRFVPFNPATLSGLTGWWDASDSATLFTTTGGSTTVAADGEVARLEDKSGNGRHFIQSTSSFRPLRKTLVKNGLDVLRFDGTDDRLVVQTGAIDPDWSMSQILSSTASTVFVVAKATAVSTDDSGDVRANDHVFSDWNIGANTGRHGYVALRSNGTALVYGRDTAIRQASLSYSAGDWKVFSARHDGTDLAFRINGGSPATVALSTQQFTNNGPAIGTNADVSQFFDGDFAELIVCNVALSAADRETVENYLLNKWGIT